FSGPLQKKAEILPHSIIIINLSNSKLFSSKKVKILTNFKIRKYEKSCGFHKIYEQPQLFFVTNPLFI
ncbi:hypothetical protein LIZ31_16330, partial [Eggerthella lenta]|nr:hypothetical protein [Eggerthella lenta]